MPVVEDEVKMASLLKRGLEEEGYSVDIASDGLTGVWMGVEHPYDAIVLDVILPDMDGFSESTCWSVTWARPWSTVTAERSKT